MMTLLNPGILSWHLPQIISVDCMLSSDMAVMPNDDLTESRDSIMALTPDNDCMLSSNMALMPNDDLVELGISVCGGSYTR